MAVALIHRDTCRGCFSTDVVKFLDLGNVPLAGGFLDQDQVDDEQRFNLSVYFCRHCSLVQILDVVPQEVLFKQYFYISSGISSLAEHFKLYAQSLLADGYLPKDGFIVEFGSNDGVLLQNFIGSSVKFLGVDPSENVSEMARKRGIPTLTGYFDNDIVGEIKKEYGLADVITGSNVFAHTDDVHKIVEAAKCLLKPEGVFVVEVHYIHDLLALKQYDTIYHEHLCYYSVSALKQIMERHGLRIVDVVRTSMHGGALRVFASRREANRREDPGVGKILQEEVVSGLLHEETYNSLGAFAQHHRQTLKALLMKLKQEGKTISGYGAPGRGTTLLNYANIGRELLDYIVDASPLRAGKLMPGVHVQILSPDELAKRPTDYSLLLAWNYAEHILAKETGYIERGGRFIIPFPEIHQVPDAMT